MWKLRSPSIKKISIKDDIEQFYILVKKRDGFLADSSMRTFILTLSL